MFSELEPPCSINPCASKDGPRTKQKGSSQSLTLTLPLSGFQRTDVVFTTRAFNPKTDRAGCQAFSSVARSTTSSLQVVFPVPEALGVPALSRQGTGSAGSPGRRSAMGRREARTVLPPSNPVKGLFCVPSALEPSVLVRLGRRAPGGRRVKLIPGGDLLSHTLGACSTIGAEGLNCRVRNGNGCIPLATATGKLEI